MDADVISCWKMPTSLGCDKCAFCIKMALAGPSGDLEASTLCVEEEGALSTLESPQEVRQQPQESQDTETKEVQNAVGAALQRRVPRRRRSIQRVKRHRIECCGTGPGCARNNLANSAQRPQEVKKT
ncbi:hypothetical protein NDU88_002306 [Pleurodeles waltl]|uniref:Uncharacterized protein n=1 Tax=Pleurodeles waltl TaxID=8319 RepID=A0AAV7LFB3_PLEWA|nr:hypothetical protein NDU88_002306 [Pleurodeles waltl]